MSLWDFKVGDRVFCVWPTNELTGGFHQITEVTPSHIKVEGFNYYCEKGRFVLMNPYVSPINVANETAIKANEAAFDGSIPSLVRAASQAHKGKFALPPWPMAEKGKY